MGQGAGLVRLSKAFAPASLLFQSFLGTLKPQRGQPWYKHNEHLSTIAFSAGAHEDAARGAGPSGGHDLRQLEFCLFFVAVFISIDEPAGRELQLDL
jgi:hypothetical protein